MVVYRTVAVECCYQNVGIATSLALTMFQGNDRSNAMGIPFFYGVCEAVLVGFYCVGCWKAGWSKAPSDAPFWKVLFRTYEVVGTEEPSNEVVGKEGIDLNDGGQYIQMGDMTTSSEREIA